MDNITMKKVAMAIELVDALENAQELAQNDIQHGAAWLRDPENTDPDRRNAMMKQCVINYKIIQVIDHLFDLDNQGSIYKRLYDDLKT